MWRRGQQCGAARCIRVCGQSRVHVASQQGISHVLSKFMANMQWDGMSNLACNMVVFMLALAALVVVLAVAVRVQARRCGSNILCIVKHVCKINECWHQCSDGEANRSQGARACVICVAVGQVDGGQAAIVQMCVRCEGAKRGEAVARMIPAAMPIYRQARVFSPLNMKGPHKKRLI